MAQNELHRQSPPSCGKARPDTEFTPAQELFDNVPYIIMSALGCVILLLVFGASGNSGIFAALYALYAALGALWIMVFVCPHCRFFGTRMCPCGYGRIASKLRARGDEKLFVRKFRRHIPVIVPLWFIPVAAGAYSLSRECSPLLIALVAAFALDAFAVLPLAARIYGCAHCSQKDDCPWMKTGK
ncbi:MAG TPA: hypothetical protein PL033_17880 [Candidatus Brocadiia bacterium]|nr:hypothetical protein [Candidatus Brocadiia bacterium]